MLACATKRVYAVKRVHTKRPCKRLAPLVVQKQGKAKARSSLSPPVGGPDKSNNLTGKQGVVFGQSRLPEKGPQPRASPSLASHQQQLQTAETTAVSSSRFRPSSVPKQPVKPSALPPKTRTVVVQTPRLKVQIRNGAKISDDTSDGASDAQQRPCSLLITSVAAVTVCLLAVFPFDF